MYTKDELEIIYEIREKRLFNKSKQKIDGNETGLVYQFRSFKNLWLILEGDSFWATDSRFSNDDAERTIGKRLGTNHGIISEVDHQNADMSQFIVCFCKVQDILSQWRGYATYGGVSIGFDFNMHAPFTTYPQKTEVKDGYAVKPEENVTCYARVINVIYYSENTAISSIKQDLLLHSCAVESDMEIEEQKRRYLAMIPYIKHLLFEEEKECRIVVNSDDFHDTSKSQFENCISFKTESERQIPFIILKPGDPIYNKKHCSVRIRIRNAGIDCDWESDLAAVCPGLDVFECVNTAKGRDRNDSHCFGCIRRQWHKEYRGESENLVFCRYQSNAREYAEISLSPYEQNSIIISQGENQKEVFEVVHKWASEKNREISDKTKRIKVWCEGHLPVRTIMVGPCKNQAEMVESIRYFCLHSKQYWLRDVDVSKSLIPYRTPSKPDS